MFSFLKFLIRPRQPNPEAGKRLLALLVGGLFTALFGYAVLGIDGTVLDTARVIRLIKSNAPERVDQAVLREDVLNGIVAKRDPYAVHFNAQEFREFQSDLDGEFVGIGVTIFDGDKGLVVREVFAGSGAAEAELRRGDILLSSGKLDLARQDVSTEVKIATMKGVTGTRVALTVRRDDQVFERQVTRKIVTWPSVRSDVFLFKGQRVGYFVIDEFRTQSDAELSRQLAAQIDSLDAVVLDVTGNPGGSLVAATYIATLFLATNQPLYWLVDRDHPDGEPMQRNFDKAEYWRAVLTPAQLRKLETLPMIVMANGGSASASELLAGALQDHGRAKVFGTQTFGKGSVQGLFDLPNGEGVKLTTAHYLTPNRHKVDGVGIKPDYTPARWSGRVRFPEFENGTFPKDELNPNWLLQAAAKLLATTPAVSVASR